MVGLPNPYPPSTGASAPLDFSGAAAAVRAVVEAERLGSAHLLNPRLATETAAIDPLPHQRIAVYERMLGQPRLRFLLADDAGAGKTIMAGLYIREMLARRLLRRVLIVPPAGLVGNWERELRTLFGLPFRILGGADARSGNPFTGDPSDLVIVSVDTLAGERMFGRLQEQEVEPYDLAVFDEAHKLSADRDAQGYLDRTDRYRLAEALAGVPVDEDRWRLAWSAHHLLLLTATPHMGKDFPYYCLWRLLEPELLSTQEAFNALDPEGRATRFIRRTKEEMVHLDGRPLYPGRVSATLSYDLTQGPVSEQALYDATTRYMEEWYNRSNVLNRSAMRLAQSVFQRRLASSTYALLRSFERRLARLDDLIDGLKSGRLAEDAVRAEQRNDRGVRDVFDTTTADEESAVDGQEEHEAAEDELLGRVSSTDLKLLEAERDVVAELLELARAVDEQGDESKFARLRADILDNPEYAGEKLIVFTEHRDTLEFLVRRMEGLGYTGHIAQIHGGMDYREREEQVEFFRRPLAQGGAQYLLATDAAGEGINLQFCWLMVNYDIPWNPARLEQRMGRIHRYRQQHDPVVILNLVAGKTREGRVLQTLLTKLEQIRKELGSDKVFDVVGRFFEGVSIRDYMAQALTEEGAERATREIAGRLTVEQAKALRERERTLYGAGGDVKPHLDRLREALERERFRRLIPGYVRRFIELAAPLAGFRIDGDLDDHFALRPAEPHAHHPLWDALASYPPALHGRLTLRRPEGDEAIWLRPGEPVFEQFRGYVAARFEQEAMKGGVFVDPETDEPYLLHVAEVSVRRGADPDIPELAREATWEHRLVAVRHRCDGSWRPLPVEQILLFRDGRGIPADATGLVAAAQRCLEPASAWLLDHVVEPLVAEHRAHLVDSLPSRTELLRRAYQYREAELLSQRATATRQVRSGQPGAAQRLEIVRRQQAQHTSRREAALRLLQREPELLRAGDVRWVAHLLVVPSTDPADRRRRDEQVEAIAMQVARAYEEAEGAQVWDVSTPERARQAGLGDWPGFDLLSRRPDGTERGIEVKGRAELGAIELTENEWAQACCQRDRYWLYVVFGCATPSPRLVRVPDPFYTLIARRKGGVVIEANDVLAAETSEEVRP